MWHVLKLDVPQQEGLQQLRLRKKYEHVDSLQMPYVECIQLAHTINFSANKDQGPYSIGAQPHNVILHIQGVGLIVT